tara:strand:+ start:8790 stop:10649 length:1860 start_codon:yes stop_codon:yes gene_type:complete
MAFPDHFLDDLKARVQLVDVVGQHVKLTRRGREWLGLCPFHNEKTPSFTVNEDKGFYHCFGCQAHGSVFDFVMQREGLSFPEAVEKLAAEAGMQVPARSPEAAAQDKARANLYDAMSFAAEWFQGRLDTGSGRAARDYLEARGLTDTTIKEFGLGHAPKGRSALKEALLARNFSERQLIDAGLVISPEDGGETFDRFRNRIMFPITDTRGRVVAFGGRALDDAPAKYLNSPETPLFHKGRLLYNLARARPIVRDEGTVVVAEGYMDVIALHQAGFAHAVAPLGTAVTEEQLGLLWRLAPEPVLCFDGDAAGWNAAARAAERALPHLRSGHSLRFALLPTGEDPDSLVRSKGPAAFRQLLVDATPLSDLLWQITMQDRDLDTPERRAGFAKDIRGVVERIGDAQVKAFYERHYRTRLDDMFSAGRRNSENRASRASRPSRGGQRTRRLSPHHALGLGVVGTTERRERVLIATIVGHPGLLELFLEEFLDIELSNLALDRLRNEIIEIARGSPGLDSATLKQHLCDKGFAATLDDIADTRIAPLAPFVRPEVPLEAAREGWENTLSVHRLAVTLPAEKSACIEEFDFTDEGFNRLKAFLGEAERSNKAETAAAGPTGTRTS